MRKMIMNTIKKYPDVRFEFCNALEGMRRYFGMEIKSCGLEIKFDFEDKNIAISANDNIFGVQPFFCLKLFGGKYIWSNLDFVGDHKWSFVFDRDSVEMGFVEKIGIAANSTSGVTDVIVVDVKTKSIEKKILNER